MDELEELKRNVDFLDELEEEDLKEEEPAVLSSGAETKQSRKMSAGQKFVVSVLIFLVIFIFGIFVMLITGKMVLPF